MCTYDPGTRRYWFQGASFDLGELVGALTAVLTATREALAARDAAPAIFRPRAAL
jgi:hypothetical protein